MKRCPACGRVYLDETLNFCRVDGGVLFNDSSSLSETQATLVKLPPRGSEEFAPTEIFGGESAASGRVSGTSSSLTAPLQRRGRRPSRTKTIESLAVLPLVNESADPQSEYLSDGITESIINTLSQIPKLRVVPRSTVFRYKGREIDPQEAGRELNVRAVLTGRMLQLGDVLVVKTELIDVAWESQLWGEQYRRKLTDVFTLQGQIAREICEKLRLQLSGEEKRRLTRRHTDSREAYDLYLKGRYYMNKRTPEWIKKGVEYFQQAIDLDPGYALAYAGLADSYGFLASSTGGQPPEEAYPKAKAAALHALEIDDSLAEAHTSLGFFWLLYGWDFDEARREFERAIELNPGYANAHDGYGFYLKATAQHDDAIRACQRAQRLDPLSLFAGVSLAWGYYFARRYELAVEHGRKALEMEPRFDFAKKIIALALAQQGRLEEAVAELEATATDADGGLPFKAHLGYVYGLAGRRDAARKILAELELLAGRQYVSSYYRAIVHLGMGEEAHALAWLERACDERSGFLAFVKVEPLLDRLRGAPRFRELMRRVGFTP